MRLSEKQRQEILSMCKNLDVTYDEIGALYGVTKSAVHSIARKHGKTRGGMRRKILQGDLTAEKLRALVDYDPETGRMAWRLRRRWKEKNGTECGWVDDKGYVHVRIEKLYLIHRLAWLYVYGKWPDGVIDHINGNPSDNRICNLRECKQIENARNRSPYHSKSSVRSGVSFDKCRKKWRAYINDNYKQIFLGRFDTQDEAIAARRAYEPVLFGEFQRATS